MNVGLVEFISHADDIITMSLTVDGQLILETSSVDRMAQELTLRDLAAVRCADGFNFTLPADDLTFEAAAQASLESPLLAMELVAACIWQAELTRLVAPEV